MIIMGIDPGLRFNGWGIIEFSNNQFHHIANGTLKINEKLSLPERLAEIYKKLIEVIKTYNPDEVAVEEVFVNVNPSSTLKLGQARGVAILTPSLLNIPVFEYSPNLIKKSVVGVGHAAKPQVDMMVKKMMPTLPDKLPADAADALAIALCHGFMRKVLR